ncbi:Lrp/AsnC family transcriptional regulator [Pseudoflavonifractor sp. AF19-9AC]|uniref:Lrp/AsnC family transcriptional regulator n=1 Tax=Pseudoflavonifractor sp. AF19-9AC TaxID=2292244 RepID=UPI001314BAEB|nr:Lrp/AsnC family transcriptional regulator [Pseudoflavonifractor sp. AF19-9AC]
MSLDNLDQKILMLLQYNARTKISEIAKDVHLSVTAVTRRMERMEDLGIIRGYRALIDPEQAGVQIHGFIIGGVYKIMLNEFYRYISSVPEIARCETIISGGKEILLEFYCRDTNHLMSFYSSDIRKYLDSMTVYLVKGPPGKDSVIALS